MCPGQVLDLGGRHQGHDPCHASSTHSQVHRLQLVEPAFLSLLLTLGPVSHCSRGGQQSQQELPATPPLSMQPDCLWLRRPHVPLLQPQQQLWDCMWGLRTHVWAGSEEEAFFGNLHGEIKVPIPWPQTLLKT